jgi:NADH-quinone oxidoreductase subunit N
MFSTLFSLSWGAFSLFELAAHPTMANQLVTAALPEVIFTSVVSYVLTKLALELGVGKAKKLLSLESLVALRRSFLLVGVLYLTQLSIGSAHNLFNGYFLTSSYIVALKILALLSTLFIFNNSITYLRTHEMHLLEYPLVLALALLFMLLLISSSNLITAFLSIVGFSLNLYVLILFDASAQLAREAGAKYFYLSTFSSGLIIYGIFILFLLAGTANYTEMAQLFATKMELTTYHTKLIQLGTLMLLNGLFFKLSAFPGHLWAAEVYEGSSAPVTAFFMVPVKVAVLSFLLQLLSVALEPARAIWQPVVMLSAVGSLIWGCLGALKSRNIRRFLAYASINQIGFLLLGVATGALVGYRSTLMYLFVYSLMNFGFLAVLIAARREDKKGLRYLTEFRGLGQSHWLLSWSVAMALLSMAGIPPLAGFFGKYYLLIHAQEQGLYGLVFVALATSLISAYYYLKVIRILWFEGSERMLPISCTLQKENQSTIFSSEAALWVFIIFAGALLSYSDFLTSSLLGPFSGVIEAAGSAADAAASSAAIGETTREIEPVKEGYSWKTYIVVFVLSAAFGYYVPKISWKP